VTAKGKMRKKGDWVAVAKGRGNSQRSVVNGSGLSNVPRTGEVGSAAYRRLSAAPRRG
jgi:hypothetical protein